MLDLIHKKYIGCRQGVALEHTIKNLRKYQKIVDIVSLNDEEFKQCSLKELKEILEVIVDKTK